MHLASGFAPLPKTLRARITLRLGSDGPASDHDLQVTPERTALRASQAAPRGHPENSRDLQALDRAARHCGWPNAIELVTCLLPALTGREFVQRHGPAKGSVHGARPAWRQWNSTAWTSPASQG